MSKALTKAQTDLEALRVELEAWVIVQTELQAQRPPARRKPAVRRTRTELITAATTPVVSPIVLSAEVDTDTDTDTDTSWLDLLDSAPVAAPVRASSPAPVVVPPAPATAPVAQPVAAPVVTEKYSSRLRREWKENKAELKSSKNRPKF